MKLLSSILLVSALSLTACDEKTNAGQAVAENEGSTKSSIVIDKAVIDEAIGSLVSDNKLVGVSALVFVDGEERYFNAFGFADREAQVPMKRDTIVQIYSMTKPVIGVALMTLYEQGKFKLDDPLENIIPELAGLKVFVDFDESGQPIYEAPNRLPTIRDAMRHTVGFTSARASDGKYVAELYTIADPMNREITLPEMAKRLGSVPLLYHPGDRWLYGPAVDVQALLVERLSGVPLDDFLAEKIFEPLKMHETQRHLTGNKLARYAVSYDWQEDGSFVRMSDEKYRSNYTTDWALKRGATGLTSTLADYMRFIQMLVNDGELDGARVLKKETVALMATDAMPAAVTDTSWLPSKGQVGFGIDFAVRIAPPIDAAEASGEVGEYFWDGGINTMFWIDPVNNLTAVMYTQYSPFGRVPLHKSFRDAVYASDETASALLLHPKK